MKTRGLKVVVTGYVGLTPAGGVTWDYMQYPLGFQELGCDVLYLEDTQQWPVYQDNSGEITCAPNVEYLSSAMRRFGMQGRWAYRDEVTGRFFGRSQEDVGRFCAAADVLVNLSCSTPMREEYAAIPVRALVDTDPMFTHVQCVTGKTLCGVNSAMPRMIASHTHLFTFGENLGQPECEVPLAGKQWLNTRQPVVLKCWLVSGLPEMAPYTSVFNWSAAKEFEFEGKRWGQKNTEFMRFLGIPRELPQVSFTIGVGQTTGDPFPVELVKSHGWKVRNASEIAADADSYQTFIRNSRAEFSVAKQTYIAAKTGWFSCRSACYLASGRPVVTQDTGWSKWIPNGCGLFAFTDSASASAAIRQIELEPERNAAAARNIAEDIFDSGKVLTKMLSDMGI